ncbi:hypothetical protein HWV62_35720 [Athelia sp. TMB]|nr:hypothetical protein HWV62_35720 [Athelia sp. TMB]
MVELPPEVWLQIILFAVPVSNFNWEYEPFEGHDDVVNERVKILSSVVLVCRAWRAFAERAVYESLKLDSRASIAALEHETDDRRKAYVRRVVLSYQNTQISPAAFHQPIDPARLFKRLPNLQILIRQPLHLRQKQGYKYQSYAEESSFPSLKRLEWWGGNGDVTSLDDILQNAPHIEHLSLGGSYTSPRPASAALHLPALATLSLQRTDAPFLNQVRSWCMPRLAHLVYGGPPAPLMLDALLAQFGPQLHTFELARRIYFLNEDYIMLVLRACPALHTLAFFVNITMPPGPVTNGALRVVRLHGALLFVDSVVNWETLSAHFAFLAGPALPALERVVLYPSHGIWDDVVWDARFAGLHRALWERKCVLQRADGECMSYSVRWELEMSQGTLLDGY